MMTDEVGVLSATSGLARMTFFGRVVFFAFGGRPVSSWTAVVGRPEASCANTVGGAAAHAASVTSTEIPDNLNTDPIVELLVLLSLRLWHSGSRPSATRCSGGSSRDMSRSSYRSCRRR